MSAELHHPDSWDSDGEAPSLYHGDNQMEATIQDSTIHYPALSTALVGMRDLRYLPAWRTRSSFYYLILSPFLTSTCLSANIDILLRVSVECHLSHTEIWGISQKTSWQISSYVDSVQCHWRIFLMQTFLSIYIFLILSFSKMHCGLNCHSSGFLVAILKQIKRNRWN